MTEMIEILKDNTYVKDPNNLNTDAFCVLDRDNKLGCCICKFEIENVEILNVEFVSKNYEKMFSDGLIRAVLNVADLRGITIGICKDKRFFDVLLKTGFKPNQENSVVTIDIVEFFKQGCKK